VRQSVFAGAAVVVVAIGIALPGSVGADASASGAAVPLVGAAYAHWATFGCSVNGTGIVATYDQPGVRNRVRLQLAAMRAAGLDSLRLLLWHVTDTSGQDWGVVPSAGGRLVEPYRSNLIYYLSDVRKAEFESLTLDFGPEYSNDPSEDVWDPAKFEENWSFIRDVRPLVKQYGPPVTRIDLLSEGAPTSYHPEILERVKDYISDMYRRYVDTFGNGDVTVSAIAPPEPNEDITQPDTSHRLQNLIDAFAASGRGQPAFFSIHVTTPWQPSSENVLYGLRQADATLTANGLSQPLVVSETAYNDREEASAIEQFRRTSSRPILEVQEWPWRTGSACKDFSVAPPFRADAYIRALSGSPPSSTLTASLTPRTINLRTPYHDPVTALEAGSYRLVVTDTSTRTGFQLVGPGVSRKTALRFRGTVAWHVSLRPGSYRFGADASEVNLQRHFVVLKPG
jgi:hypothetical protein